MTRIAPRLLTICAATALSLAATGPAAAGRIDADNPWTYTAAERTPDCRTHPNAPIVGRISGESAGMATTGLSYVGCFDTLEACTAWRLWIVGNMGRIILNQCEQRR